MNTKYRIRELRQEKGWRQADLAQKLSKERQTIGNYETGERSIDAETLCRLCEIFECSADYLLCRTSVRKPCITKEQEELLLAWDAAPGHIKDGINALLAPYRKNTESSTA